MNKTKSKISSQTKWAIKTYVKQGYSANKIQKKLKNQGLGIQRKKLLAEVRKAKGKKLKTNSKKYTPKKYRVRISPPARKPVFFGKHIAVFKPATTWRYKKIAKKLGYPTTYSARFEFYGVGKNLARAYVLAMKGIVPKYEDPFVECSARDFLNDPYKFGERGYWIGKPEITS